MFALKSFIEERPYIFIVTSLGVTILVMSYQLRILEAPISEISGQDFNLYSNSMWCMIITLTTVGYGDYYAKTVFGRIMTCLISFWGMFIVSLMVVKITNSMTFSDDED